MCKAWQNKNMCKAWDLTRDQIGACDLTRKYGILDMCKAWQNKNNGKKRWMETKGGRGRCRQAGRMEHEKSPTTHMSS
jgi:hypothetical protein